MTSKSTLASGWIPISREMLSGEGLRQAAPEDEVHAAGFLELLTPHLPPEKRLELLRGEIWVALFEHPEGVKTRCDFFPGDEFVYVVSGSVTLTDSRSAEALTFNPGEHFLVPKGWQGTWTSAPSYREVAVCSTDWLSAYERSFRSGTIDPQRRDTVLPIDVEGAREHLGAGDRLLGLSSAHIQGSDLVIQLVAAGGESRFATAERARDAFVHVLDGGVTLEGENGVREAFGAGDCFVVTRDFRGTWELAPEYLGLVVTGGAPS